MTEEKPLTISQLQEQLEKIKSRWGDLTVCEIEYCQLTCDVYSIKPVVVTNPNNKDQFIIVFE